MTRRLPAPGTPVLTLLALALLVAACDEPRPVLVPVDNDQLTGVYWEPRKELAPAVALLPMLGGSKEDWHTLAERLHRQGYGVLAVDLREQGRTQRDTLLADARAAVSFLRAQKKVDAARIGLVGASLGANVALSSAAEEPLIRLTVLLSPGLNYRGVATEPALRYYGDRRLLLLAAEEDVGSAAAVRRLSQAAPYGAARKLYPGQAHGTDLLTIGLPVADDIVAFLQAHL